MKRNNLCTKINIVSLAAALLVYRHNTITLKAKQLTLHLFEPLALEEGFHLRLDYISLYLLTDAFNISDNIDTRATSPHSRHQCWHENQLLIRIVPPMLIHCRFILFFGLMAVTNELRGSFNK
jgi:hypothetical protein